MSVKSQAAPVDTDQWDAEVRAARDREQRAIAADDNHQCDLRPNSLAGAVGYPGSGVNLAVSASMMTR
jgi:hypothetical protein